MQLLTKLTGIAFLSASARATMSTRATAVERIHMTKKWRNPINFPIDEEKLGLISKSLFDFEEISIEEFEEDAGRMEEDDETGLREGGRRREWEREERTCFFIASNWLLSMMDPA
uniref:Uncharacterized protein n=1 Tax=Pristionchus pacificus TaxID=54126 RepID=A0A2A6CFL1_PRIPA|eukprot:PDM77025.1 hypothetical protein PRIPAC_42420 [Pristionchus pacificus]